MILTPAKTPDEYIACLTGWQRSYAQALRSAVVASAPELEERLKWGDLVYFMNGPVLLIRAEPHRVLFGFWRGQRLRHIEPRLRAGGKYEMATLELVEGTPLDRATVVDLVHEASRLNRSLGDPTTTRVTLRPMTEQDLPMLHAWLNRPHIVEWWGGEAQRPTLAQVRAQYLPRVLAEQRVMPYIALRGGQPIGYAQSYVALGSGDGWWEDETDPGVRGIDQSLADATLLGQGLGTQLVKALVELLFNDPQVTKIQTDPAPENLRAVRCYEKAGFRRIKNIVTPDGPAVYMLCERPPRKEATA